ISENIVNLFKESKTFKDYGNARVGLDTGNNNKFIRFWFEVNKEKIVLNAKSKEYVFDHEYKWVPHTKGGSYRKWYGNLEHIIAFDKENYNSLLESGNKLPSREYYFLEGFNWSRISTTKFAVRYTPVGTVFNSVSPTAFVKKDDLVFFISFMNTKVVSYLLQLINPTMHFEAGNINVLPIKYDINFEIKKRIEDLGNSCIEISKNEWDSFEVSWDFKYLPLLAYKESLRIETALEQLNQYKEEQINSIRANEEEINRIFSEIYC
ncbi:SAM-dependent methyltransferase, partial [Butyricicoccus sp. 1XD8-22]